MFYKVIQNNKIIDVLDGLVFLKYQSKHDRMQLCNKEDAQAIFSSDRKNIWHEESLYDLPKEGYDTVRVEEIDQYEYKRLKALHCMTFEEITDNIILCLIKGDCKTDAFTNSLMRLYQNQALDKNDVMNLFNNNKITKEQLLNILGN